MMWFMLFCVVAGVALNTYLIRDILKDEPEDTEKKPCGNCEGCQCGKK